MATERNENLAGSLKRARTQLGFTQKRMAAELGVPVNTYARWEQGRPIRLERVIRLAMNWVYLQEQTRLDQEGTCDTQ